VAWTSGDPSKRTNDADLSACFSTDNGVTWSPVVALNTNASIDRGNDAFPGVKTDGAGTWVAVWSSNNVLPGNTNNEDTDIHAATSTLTFGANIVVLSPDGGEKVKAGKRQTIDWLTIGDTGQRARINLIRDGAFVLEIEGNANNDGSYTWRVPVDIEPGKGYKVQVGSVDAAGIRDASDSRFRIVPK
jgi:hypothetical protein